MQQNGCAVTSTSEAPFVMSRLLSKLDASDNIEFGREMLRMGKEENVLNLIDWLNKEASLRSRIKRDTNYRNNSREHRSDNNANDSGLDQDEKVHWVSKQSIYFPHVLCTKSQQLMRNGKL